MFFFPIGVSLTPVFFGLSFRGRSVVWMGVALPWISSTPLVSGCPVRSVEASAERIRPADVRNADAIVVLSIGRVTAPGPAAASE